MFRSISRRDFMKGIMVGGVAVGSAGLLAACGSSSSTSSSEEATSSSEDTATEETSSSEGTATETAAEESTGISYPLSGDNSFTYGLTLDSAWSDRYDSYDELPFGQALEEATGVDMEMVHVADKTAMNLLLASGDLPQGITFNFASNYSGGTAKAYTDGLFKGLTEDFLAENAPDYLAYLQENDDVRKQVTADDGNIYGFAYILGDELSLGGQQGLIVRDDWCEELGIDLPETKDEFEDMLIAFRDELGVEIPFEFTTSILDACMSNGYITSPFGLVSMDVYQVDGTAHLGYYEDEFKDVLEWLHHLYEEGLIDPNFATVDTDTVKANLLNDVAGVSAGAAGSFLGTLLTTNADVEGYSLAGVRNLVANEGETPLYGHMNNSVPGNMTVISSSCDDDTAAVVAQFFNYGYTEEGHMLYIFGIEDVSYTFDSDGEPVYTDLIMNNPDGLTVQQALSEYERGWTNGPFVADSRYLLQYYQTEAQQDALLNKWSDNTSTTYKFPNVTIPDSRTSMYSSLTSELETYRDEMIIKFVRGDESLDNWDSYISSLESMGVADLLEIYQSALDDYNAK